MHRERTTAIGQGKETDLANIATQMTRFEIVQCGCGHEWVRPDGRVNTLPCGQCGNARLNIRRLLAGPPNAVSATVC